MMEWKSLSEKPRGDEIDELRNVTDIVRSIHDLLETNFNVSLDDALLEYVVEMYLDSGSPSQARLEVSEVLAEAIKDAQDRTMQEAVEQVLQLLSKDGWSDPSREVPTLESLPAPADEVNAKINPQGDIRDQVSSTTSLSPWAAAQCAPNPKTPKDSVPDLLSSSEIQPDAAALTDEALLSLELQNTFWDGSRRRIEGLPGIHQDSSKLDPQVKRSVVERFAVRIHDTLEIREGDGRMVSALEESRVPEHLAVSDETGRSPVGGSRSTDTSMNYYCNDNRTRAAQALQQQRDDAKQKHAQAIAKQRLERAAEQMRKEKEKQRTAKKERRYGRH